MSGGDAACNRNSTQTHPHPLVRMVRKLSDTSGGLCRLVDCAFLVLTTLAMLGLAARPVYASPPVQTSTALLPQNSILYGPHAAQQLTLELMRDGAPAGEINHKVLYSSSNPRVVSVGGNGLAVARGNGKAVVTARCGTRSATTTVRVAGWGSQQEWSFRNDVLPVLTREGCNGGSCHGAAAGKGGLKLSLRGFDPDADYDVLTHQANGRRVAPGRPLDSLLLLKPTNRIPHGGGRRIEPGSREESAIAGWIAAGAPSPRATDKRIDRLEIVPPAATLHPGDQQQMLVTAHYSDGSVADVTSLVKFGAVDGTVATVNEAGQVHVIGRGETAITAWYSSKVSCARVVSPYPGARTNPFATRTNGSIIDALVMQKLTELNIPPSSRCSDSDFLRRASLDTVGALPTLEESRQFLADASPDKRLKLIDHLLSKPEFADYWAYKWSDLLLLNSKSMPGETLNSFYSYIHKSVEENKPWNRFVTEIVTARGSTLENGAAGFFVIHKDPFDLTETTTQAFMGLSLMCAHCHNHPMEKWTQKDYYQMANMYARVRMKNGDKPGEVFVLAANSGDIPHPRLGTPLAPRPLDGTPLKPDDTADRRVKLAEWLTSPSNPSFARAIVNRIWRNFMGRGIVEAEDDLRATNPPTNAPLMDALSDEFIKNGYDIKKLIREILVSDTYQRSSDPVGVNRTDVRYFSHYIVRRLAAEPLLDAIAQVTGIATEFKDLPKSTRALQLKDNQVASYFLTAFGRPVREKTCACERQQDPDVAQALHLSNGDVINARLRTAGSAVEMQVKTGVSDREALDRLYLTAYCRYPTAKEADAELALLASGSAPSSAKMETNTLAHREALEDVYWAVLTSREFVFNH